MPCLVDIMAVERSKSSCVGKKIEEVCATPSEFQPRNASTPVPDTNRISNLAKQLSQFVPENLTKPPLQQ